MIIESVTIDAYRLPLAASWGDQTHAISHIELIVVDVGTDLGVRGCGFSYTVGVGAKAIEALLRWDVVPRLIGAEAAPRPVFQRLWTGLHDAGGGGITTMAIAAVDIALWDLAAKAAGRPLVDVLGRQRDSIAAYGSGVNLNLSVDDLLAQVDGWLSAGFRDVKIKVGKPDLAEDVERVAAVRHLLGPGPRLMVDANQGWDLPTALAATRALAPFDLHWTEEPLISDDIRGHAQLRRSSGSPIAVGENVYTIHQFAEYLRLEAVDYLQADVVRVGGITPWLDIAALAAAHSVPMAPHFMLEISGQLLCCIANAHILEDVSGGSFRDLGVLAADVGTAGGRFSPPTVAGHGIVFDRTALAPHRIGDDPPAPRIG